VTHKCFAPIQGACDITEPDRPQPFFVADNCALDFLNSVAAPWGGEIEWLANGRDLLDWLEQAGLLPTGVAKQFSTEFSASAMDDVAFQARDLREWLRDFVITHSGKPFNPEMAGDLERVNRLLTADETFSQIVLPEVSNGARPQSLLWQQVRRWRQPEDLLLPIAESIAKLVCRADFSRVRNCEGPACTLWFHDISKNHTRRWCTMSVCGNRAKAAAHRARKRTKSGKLALQ